MGIIDYLNTSGFAFDPSSFLTFRDAFRSAPEVEQTQFVDRALAMPYQDYLKTIYWGIVRGWVMVDRKRCRFCGGGYALTVHHRSYANRGREAFHLEDLDLLCRDCHENKHGLASIAQIKTLMQRRRNAWKYPEEAQSTYGASFPGGLRTAFEVFREEYMIEQLIKDKE